MKVRAAVHIQLKIHDIASRCWRILTLSSYLNIRMLLDFSDCFQDFEKISKTLKLVDFPHLVETESAPLDLQMELVEIKNEQLVQKFKDEENLLETWKSAIKYPMLRELAKETLALFGSTYVCESAFSKMKYLKNEYRTRLLDSNWESELRLMYLTRHPTLQG